MAPANGARGLAPESVGARKILAASSDLSPDVVVALADDKSAAVRRVVAARPDVPLQTLTRLAVDHDRHVRKAVAANPSTPPAVLVLLVEDAAWQVRWAIPGNPASADDVHVAILDSSDDALRGLLAETSSLPRWVAERLATDPVTEVCHSLASRTIYIDVLDSLVTDSVPRVRWGVALKPAKTSGHVDLLVADRYWGVRAVLAQMRGLPDAVYERLAADRSEAVRDFLAAFGAPSWNVPLALSQDDSPDVRTHALDSLERGERTGSTLPRGWKDLARQGR